MPETLNEADAKRQWDDPYAEGLRPKGAPTTSTPSHSDLSVSRLRDQIKREISNLAISTERLGAAVVEVESLLVSMKDRQRAQSRQMQDLKQALTTIERLA